jgi:predicted Zn finger-like uncharacterized protein
MRTRCPDCSTIFRVTSEQLRLKAGKVRCGQCQGVFNAFDHFLTESVSAGEVHNAESDIQPVADRTAALQKLVEINLPVVPQTIEVLPAKAALDPIAAPAPAPAPAPQPEAHLVEVSVVDVGGKLLETPEESAMAAREAGLMAARELADTPAYNRWAAGPLAAQGVGGFEHEATRYPIWPFVVFSLLLVIALLGQSVFYFRTELVQKFPAMAELYRSAAVEVPLPRNAEWVSIESSDLQSDNARGLFVLQATLHNRANYAQDWPALELTFTDTGDKVVSRRVLRAVEYLPPATESPSFPASGEIAIKLWIEAKDIGAAGYRLYLFYP